MGVIGTSWSDRLALSVSAWSHHGAVARRFLKQANGSFAGNSAALCSLIFAKFWSENPDLCEGEESFLACLHPFSFKMVNSSVLLSTASWGAGNRLIHATASRQLLGGT